MRTIISTISAKAPLLQAVAKLGISFSCLVPLCFAGVFSGTTEGQTKLSGETSMTSSAGDGVPLQSPTGSSTDYLRIDLAPVDGIDFPVISAKVMLQSQVNVHLAVSLHSNDTWLKATTNGICSNNSTARGCFDGQLPGEQWEYVGLDDLSVNGWSYEADLDIADRIFKGLPIGLAYQDSISRDGGIWEADGILGLGPASTFLAGKTDISLYPGDGDIDGSLILGRYYFKSRALGNFTAFNGDSAGSLVVKVAAMEVTGYPPMAWIQNQGAVLDTESPYISLPDSHLQTFANDLGMNVTENEWVLAPKDSLPAQLTITLANGDNGQVEVLLAAEDYLQDGPSQGLRRTLFKRSSSNDIILGRPVVKKLYLVRPQNGPFYLAQASNASISADEAPIPFDSIFETSTNTVQATGKATGSAGKSKIKPHLGAIVGGVVSGLVLIALGILAIIFFLKRRGAVHHRPFEKRSSVNPSTRSLVITPSESSVFSSSSPPPENRYLMNDYEYIQEPLPNRVKEVAVYSMPAPHPYSQDAETGRPFSGPPLLMAVSPPAVVSPPAYPLSSRAEEDDRIMNLGRPSGVEPGPSNVNALSRSASFSTVSGEGPSVVSPSASLKERWRNGSLRGIAAGWRRDGDKMEIARLPMYNRGAAPDPAL